MSMQRLTTIEGEELPCPICDTSGYWIDDINEAVQPSVAREDCSFCGGSGYMMVATKDILEGSND